MTTMMMKMSKRITKATTPRVMVVVMVKQIPSFVSVSQGIVRAVVVPAI